MPSYHLLTFEKLVELFLRKAFCNVNVVCMVAYRRYAKINIFENKMEKFTNFVYFTYAKLLYCFHLGKRKWFFLSLSQEDWSDHIHNSTWIVRNTVLFKTLKVWKDFLFIRACYVPATFTYTFTCLTDN